MAWRVEVARDSNNVCFGKTLIYTQNSESVSCEGFEGFLCAFHGKVVGRVINCARVIIQGAEEG